MVGGPGVRSFVVLASDYLYNTELAAHVAGIYNASAGTSKNICRLMNPPQAISSGVRPDDLHALLTTRRDVQR